MRSFPRGFTLIELLVVIAIIAILSVIVVVTLNPAELLRQSRDANRLSDMGTLNSALGIYLSQSGSSIGTNGSVYVSIADPAATSTLGDQCQGLGLLALSATYTYGCAQTNALRAVNGTGWVPVNFGSIATGAPFGNLPVDPVDQSSSRLYYSYMVNGSQYEVTAAMESQKYKAGGANDEITGDGGPLASVYEKGTQVGLEPVDYGDASLVGYWPLTEGTGTVAYDYSGNNVTGTWQGVAISGSHYTGGKIGSYAGNFLSANSNIVSTTFQYSLTANSNFTWAMWVNIANASSNVTIIGERATGSWIKITPTAFEYNGGVIMSYAIPFNAWHFVAVIKSGSAFTYYDNGAAVASTTNSGAPSNIPFYIGGDANYPGDHTLSGQVADVRLYTGALSAAQVQAMYTGGK